MCVDCGVYCIELNKNNDDSTLNSTGKLKMSVYFKNDGAKINDA